jgi:hypothetical protein
VRDERFRPFVVPRRHPARRQLEAGWEMYLAIGQEAQETGTERIRHIVFSLLVRVWRLYRAALALAADGFGPESESMSRAMYEANLTAFWAASNPAEAVERFNLHIDFISHLQHEAQPTDELVAPMDAVARNQAIKWFGRYGELPWSGRRVRELDADLRSAIETAPLDGYVDTIHRWLNWSLHGSPMNLFRGVDHTSASRIFYVAPHEKDIADALTFGGSQVILSIAIMSLFNMTTPSQNLTKRIFEVWRSCNPAAYETGRNDPCPCGSGKKYRQGHLLPAS